MHHKIHYSVDYKRSPTYAVFTNLGPTYGIFLRRNSHKWKVEVQGILCLRCFLRLWQNKCVSRKLCKRRSDLVLNGQMRVPKYTVCI